MGQTYPLPITAAMVTPANADGAAKPRYSGDGATEDWHGGTTGNDVDAADATQAIAGQNGGVHPDYEPRHQEEKGEMMVPPLTVLSDIGKDYGEFAGLTGRDGWIEPGAPYSAKPEPPEPPE